MFIVSMKQNSVGGRATTNIARSQYLSALNTKSTKAVAGFGRDISAQKVTVAWEFVQSLSSRIVRFMKIWLVLYQRGWSSTTSAETGRASTLHTCGQLRSAKTTTSGKSCAAFSLGAVCRTRQRNDVVEEAYRQPDLFVEPPTPPKQEAMDI